MKKINYIMIFLFAIIVSSIFTKGVDATNYKVVSKFDDTISNLKYKGDNVWYNGAHGLPFQSWSNEAAYCTKFRLQRPSGTKATCKLSIWDSERIQVGVASIIMNANASNSGMTKNYYYADLAINYFLFQYNLKSDGTKDYNNQVTSYNATKAELNNVFGDYISYYNKAVDAVEKYTQRVDVSLKGESGNKSSFKVNSDNKDSVSNTYTINGTNIDSAKVTVSLSNAPSGVKVYINNKETKTLDNLKKGDKFTVKVDGLSESESFTVNINATAQMNYYVAANYKCTLGGVEYQSITLNRVIEKAKTDSVKTSFKIVTYDAPDYPDLKIVKEDKSGNAVRGAGIRLYSKESDGTYSTIETFEDTDASEYTYKDVEEGEYCVAEYKAPNGYFLDDTRHCFTITKDSNNNNITIKKVDDKDDQITINDNSISIKIVNEPTVVRIRKVNEQGNYLPGAKLKLTNRNGETVELNGEKLEWVSTNDSKDITGLPAGTYYVYEDEAPDGYVKTDDYRVITITRYTKGTISIAFANRPNSVSISKIDITSQEELPGATLRVLNENGDIVTLNGEKLEWVSTDEPKKISKLPVGTYYLEETRSPKGYKLMKEKIKFSIDEYGKVTVNDNTQEDSVVIMSNTLNKVYISKQDITTKKELPGAHLILKNEANEVMAEWDSTTEPHLIEGLIPGTYILSETTAPEGYSLSTETVTFTVNEDGSVDGDVVMYNTPIPNVPNTLSMQSILITIGGLVLIGVGTVLYIYGLNKRKNNDNV